MYLNLSRTLLSYGEHIRIPVLFLKSYVFATSSQLLIFVWEKKMSVSFSGMKTCFVLFFFSFWTTKTLLLICLFASHFFLCLPFLFLLLMSLPFWHILPLYLLFFWRGFWMHVNEHSCDECRQEREGMNKVAVNKLWWSLCSSSSYSLISIISLRRYLQQNKGSWKALCKDG